MKDGRNGQEIGSSAWPLSRRLTVAATAIIAVAAVLTVFLSYRTTLGFLKERYRDHIRVLAEYVAMQAELGLVLKDVDMLHRVVEGLPDRADLFAVEVLSDDGSLVVRRQRDATMPAESALVLEVPVWTEDLSGLTPQLDSTPTLRSIGTVRIAYGLGTLRDLGRSLARRFAVLSVAVTVGSVLVYGWIARSLVRPLRRLEAAAQEVALGRLDVRAGGGGVRETDRVARTFNSMLQALKERERQLEQINARMARQEALAEVGRFSAIVAHEIKNPLTIIRSSLQVLRREEPQGETRAMVMDFMEEEVERIDRLVRDFLLFAKPVQARFQRGDLNVWCSVAVEKLRLMAHSSARLELHGMRETAVTAFDATLLETALGHLIRNALDVTPPGAAIHLRTWIDTVEGEPGGSWHASPCEEEAPGSWPPEGASRETLPGTRFARPGQQSFSKANASAPSGSDGKPAPRPAFTAWWCLAVDDAGPGVPEEHRAKIFEPFFTTKAKGSGLGLAMVRRIMEAHGGDVRWESGPNGSGSRFLIRIPLVLGSSPWGGGTSSATGEEPMQKGKADR